jgi:hypothetical protein
MSKSLRFARFIHLIEAIDQLPIPAELYNRYRTQYDYILVQICLGDWAGKKLSVSNLYQYPILGSQPTVNKRLRELINYGLVQACEGIDRRQKVLVLTNEGKQYLEACSEAMSKALDLQVAQQ